MPFKKNRKQPRSEQTGVVDLDLDNFPQPSRETDGSQANPSPDKRQTGMSGGEQRKQSGTQTSASKNPAGRLLRVTGSGLSSFNALLPTRKDMAAQGNAQRALTGARVASQTLRDGTPPPRPKPNPEDIFERTTVSPRKPALRNNRTSLRKAAEAVKVCDPSANQLQQESEQVESAQSSSSRLRQRRAAREGEQVSADAAQQPNRARRSVRTGNPVEEVHEGVQNANVSSTTKRKVGRPRKSDRPDKQDPQNKTVTSPKLSRSSRPRALSAAQDTSPQLSSRRALSRDNPAEDGGATQSSPRKRGRPPKRSLSDKSTKAPPRKKQKVVPVPKAGKLLIVDPGEVVFDETAAAGIPAVGNDRVGQQEADKAVEGGDEQSHAEGQSPFERAEDQVDGGDNDGDNDGAKDRNFEQAEEQDEEDESKRGGDEEGIEVREADGTESAETLRLYAQWRKFNQIVRALRQVGAYKEKGKTIPASRAVCRDEKAQGALRHIEHLGEKLRDARNLQQEQALSIDVTEFLPAIEQSVESLYSGVDFDKDNKRRCLAIYRNVFPGLVILIKEMILFFIDGRQSIAMNHVEHIIRVMRVVEELYVGSKNYTRPDVTVVASVRNRVCVPMRSIQKELSKMVAKWRAQRAKDLKDERKEQAQQAAFQQMQQEKESQAPIIKLCRDWHDLHRERLGVEGALYANPAWKNAHLAHDKMHPETDANGTEMERVNIFPRRFGPHPDRVVAARAVQWAPIEDDMFLNSLREFQGDLVKVIRTHCRGPIPGPKGILNAYNVTELAVRAADLREWLIREQMQGYGFVEDWITAMPHWVKGKMPQVVLGSRVELDDEEIDPL